MVLALKARVLSKDRFGSFGNTKSLPAVNRRGDCQLTTDELQAVVSVTEKLKHLSALWLSQLKKHQTEDDSNQKGLAKTIKHGSPKCLQLVEQKAEGSAGCHTAD